MGGNNLMMSDEVIISSEVLYLGVKKEEQIACPIAGEVLHKTDSCRHLGLKSVCNWQRIEFKLVI